MFEVLFVGVGQRPHAEVKLIAVGRAEIEGDGGWRRRGRLALALPKSLIEVEAMRQHEGAVVIAVVAQVIIGDGGLRRNRHQGGMGVQQCGGGEKAGLGDAPHAHLAGVVADVFHQPIDGVEGVGAFVEIARALRGLVGADGGVFALAEEAAAHVLIDEDEFIAREEFGGA